MSLRSAIETRLERKLFLDGVVDATEQLTPKMRAIWISCPAIADVAYTAGQHVRVQTGALLGLDLLRGDTLRTYSVWKVDRTTKRVALCVFDNPGQGPGARWAKLASVGDVVRFRRPEGKLVASRHNGLHLFCGDETASVPFAAMLHALDPSARAVVLLETEAGAEDVVLGAERHGLRSVLRGHAPTGSPGPLVEELRQAAADGVLAATTRTAYLAGEARTCNALRALLLSELGWRRDSIVLKPFWTPGVKGLE
jgi:NADPH-dependent ferric siderophore reductase